MLRDSRAYKPRKVGFGARATHKRIGSFVFARIKLVFARNGFYTRIDLYELVLIALARSSNSYWLARIGSDRSYRAHIVHTRIGSYWSYRSCWLVLTRICPYRTRISSYQLVLVRFGLRHTRASIALVLARGSCCLRCEDLDCAIVRLSKGSSGSLRGGFRTRYALSLGKYAALCVTIFNFEL